jgi:hypothetical protein
MLRGTERPGDRAPRAEEFGPTLPGYPNYSGDGGSAASSDDAGDRVSVNGVERRRTGQPGTGSRLRRRRSGNRPTMSGRHRAGQPAGRRETTDRATGNRVSTPATEVGQPTDDVGAVSAAGQPVVASRRQQGRATGRLAEKRHRPPDSLGSTTGDVFRSRRRLTPVDRPVVDRSTFRAAPGGCACSGRRHRPGPLSFSGRPHGRDRGHHGSRSSWRAAISAAGAARSV